jgi:hypothetical protein
MVDGMEIIQAATKVKDTSCGSSYLTMTFALITNVNTGRCLWELFFVLNMGK